MKAQKSNFFNEDLNPCVQESRLSAKCLEDNTYDYDKCKLYFLNYTNCKKFWGAIKKQRTKAGITPSMPDKEERAKIMKAKEEGVNVISGIDLGMNSSVR